MNLQERINAGLQGDFQGLKNGFERINEYIFGIQKGTYYLIGGQSGTYKTTLADFILLNAIQDAKSKNIKLNVFYYSFEIDKLTKQCNWLSQVAFQKYQKIIPPEKIKGLGDFRLSPEEQEIINDCIPDVQELFNSIEFEFVPVNPTGIYNKLWKFCSERGKFTYTSYTNGGGETKQKIEKFVPNDSKEMYLVIVDHLYFLRKESRDGKMFNTKENIDKFSEYCVELKNMFGCTFINIQQFNRTLSSVERQKFKGADLSPSEDSFKDTGNTYQDADIVMGTMNAFKLDMDECLGYDINKLKQNFIMLKIIKNRLSKDNIAIGLYANPKAGSFIELPSPSNINYTQFQ